jgi:hypothetical protein
MTEYTNYKVLSWYLYQSKTPTHLQSIEHFHKTYCLEQAKLYDENVIVLCENAIKMTGYRCVNGLPARQVESDGFINVRTGKKYLVYSSHVTPVEPDYTTDTIHKSD